MRINNKKIYFFAILFSVLFIICGNKIAARNSKNITVQNLDSEMDEQVFAKVTEIDSVSSNPDDNASNIVKFTAVITGGKYKNFVVHATQYAYSNNSTMPSAVSVNDKVVLSRLSSGKKSEWAFENYERINQIMLLLLIFAALLLLFGGKKGVSTILSLSFTCLSIFYAYIPWIMAGFNIYLSTIIICIYIITVTFALSGGANIKSLSAAIGCTGGVVFSGLIYVTMEHTMKLTGFYNTDSSRIIELFSQQCINLKGVVFAMITIGALGAVMDVAMSISSSLGEISSRDKSITRYSIVKSGINIGKDIMGTMTNTLILAYIGSNLTAVLIYSASNYPLLQLLNKEEIVIEFLQSLAGSLGMLLTIPFTAVISAFLLTKNKKGLRKHKIVKDTFPSEKVYKHLNH